MVTAAITMSDVKDEIDLEWIAATGQESNVQTNYWYLGVANCECLQRVDYALGGGGAARGKIVYVREAGMLGTKQGGIQPNARADQLQTLTRSARRLPLAATRGLRSIHTKWVFTLLCQCLFDTHRRPKWCPLSPLSILTSCSSSLKTTETTQADAPDRLARRPAGLVCRWDAGAHGEQGGHDRLERQLVSRVPVQRHTRTADPHSNYPSTPSRIQISIWPAGISSSANGTITWAGGLIDWTSPDYTANGYYWNTVQSVNMYCQAEAGTNANTTGWAYTGTGAGGPVSLWVGRGERGVGGMGQEGWDGRAEWAGERKGPSGRRIRSWGTH